MTQRRAKMVQFFATAALIAGAIEYACRMEMFTRRWWIFDIGCFVITVILYNLWKKPPDPWDLDSYE